MSSLSSINDARAEAEAGMPKIGRVLAGRYRLAELLAKGGMASVFRASTEGEPREVAVKIMHPALAREATFTRRFQREAELAGRLVHQRIARLIDHGVDGGLHFLVMELLVGEDLFDVMRRQGRLDEVSARRVLIEVCEALSEAHGLGVVHRDLKLENVFVARDAFGSLGVKVLDFGVAKMRKRDENNPDSMPSLTAAGELLGTPEYMSPEQCRGDTPGPSCDIYACGVLLYTLLTGRPPFLAKNPVQLMFKHLSEEPKPPSAHRPGLDPGLEALVLRTLAKDPAHRPRSAASLAEALRALGRTPPLVPESIRFTVRRARPSSASSEEPTRNVKVEPMASDAGGEEPELPPLPKPSPLTAAATTLSPPGAAAAVLASPWRLIVALLLALVIGVVVGHFGLPARG